MKKILTYSIILLLGLGAVSCDLDFVPTDKMTSQQIKSDPDGAEYLTDGCYSMFKDRLSFSLSSSSGNTYVRHYFQMSEFRGDNTVISGRSSDPLYNAGTYSDNANLYNLSYLWWIAYRIIYTSNIVIESVEEGSSVGSDHLLGENYFFRALCHFNMVTLFARQYTHGRENPGVIIRTSSASESTVRATVGEVYDQVVEDLKKAIELMDKGQRRGHAGYVSKASAQGLLTRVYLYMEENQKVVDLVNEMLSGAAPETKLDANIGTYYANALSSVETLWAVAHTTKDSKAQSSLASMYLTDGVGWGEIYYSDPLVKLFTRYPHDKRWSDIHRYNTLGMPEGSMMVRWPADDDGVNFFRAQELLDITMDESVGKYYIDDIEPRVYIETEIVNTYPQNYIILDGEKKEVIVSEKSAHRNSYPRIYNIKYSYQNGDPMLSSPVVIRWGEVILNRAEAYAKLNNDAGALADVNTMRKRAGLSGDELFTAENYRERGYSSILEVVLDERRLELCFEGQRAFDVYRNKMSLDRRYAGMQEWEVVQYTDNRIPFRIPYIETSVSGIPQNP